MAATNPNRGRRRLLTSTIGGVAAIAARPFTSAAQPLTRAGVCQLTPEQEEGPFYLAHQQFRSDLAEDRVGIPLILNIRLYDPRACRPLAGALVEIWSCDGAGEYSGFDPMPFAAPPGAGPHSGGGLGGMPSLHHPPGTGPADGPRPMVPPPAHARSNQKTFLRGIQRSDSQGYLTFNTLYPGCYQGRVNHIHLKVRIPDATQEAMHVAHTGQMFFPDEITTTVLAEEPYKTNQVERTLLEADTVYSGQSGSVGILTLNQMNPSEVCGGFIGIIAFGIDPDATPERAG